MEFNPKMDADAWTFLDHVAREYYRAFELCGNREFVSYAAKLLVVQIVFGEPARTVWMTSDDFPDAIGLYLVLVRQTATKWCERKFGKLEGAENTSTEEVR